MKIFRVIAISLPQLLLLLNVGARFDLLSGFNRTDYGFTTLVFLFVLVPLFTLAWLLAEITLSIVLAKRQNKNRSFFMPGLALLFFVESAVIDIFLLSQARM